MSKPCAPPSGGQGSAAEHRTHPPPRSPQGWRLESPSWWARPRDQGAERLRCSLNQQRNEET